LRQRGQELVYISVGRRKERGRDGKGPVGGCYGRPEEKSVAQLRAEAAAVEDLGFGGGGGGGGHGACALGLCSRAHQRRRLAV
jgi:hypothetical protein